MRKLLLLFLVALALQLVSGKFPFYTKKAFSQKPVQDLGNPLVLTSLLKQGQIQAAQDAAKVDLADFKNVTSYAGYFTVDEPNNGNLFFWFFPSANNYANDPVLLWLQGGPGASSLLALFTEHGPFIVESDTVSLREYSWHKNYSVLYIDQPVGTGFSFTEGDYVTNQTQVGDHLYSALIQFFTLFPELQERAFYVSGESYGGKYVPAISYTIHQRNPSASLKINLQGVIIGNGLSDPVHQFDYGDLLYQLGLIDLPTLNAFNRQQNVTISLIKQERFDEATAAWNAILEYLFYANTALDNIYNFIKDIDDTPSDWANFIIQDRVRTALHVGNAQYSDENYDVYNGLYADITKSVAPWVSELLSNYRVLIFNGQLDIIVGYVLTANYLQNLDFSSAAEYQAAQRQIWTVGNRVAGYVKIAGNLTEVLVRDAGHMVPTDQPEAAYDLINRFIANRFV